MPELLCGEAYRLPITNTEDKAYKTAYKVLIAVTLTDTRRENLYSIKTDHVDKIIYIELSGIMSKDEVIAYTTEVNTLLSQLESKEYSMYANLAKLDPVSQDSLPYLITASKNSLLSLRKIATVHKRTVTHMQMRKIETNANEGDLIINKIMRFRSRIEAMHYLKS